MEHIPMESISIPIVVIRCFVFYSDADNAQSNNSDDYGDRAKHAYSVLESEIAATQQ